MNDTISLYEYALENRKYSGDYLHLLEDKVIHEGFSDFVKKISSYPIDKALSIIDQRHKKIEEKRLMYRSILKKNGVDVSRLDKTILDNIRSRTKELEDSAKTADLSKGMNAIKNIVDDIKIDIPRLNLFEVGPGENPLAVYGIPAMIYIVSSVLKITIYTLATQAGFMFVGPSGASIPAHSIQWVFQVFSVMIIGTLIDQLAVLASVKTGAEKHFMTLTKMGQVALSGMMFNTLSQDALKHGGAAGFVWLKTILFRLLNVGALRLSVALQKTGNKLDESKLGFGISYMIQIVVKMVEILFSGNWLFQGV